MTALAMSASTTKNNSPGRRRAKMSMIGMRPSQRYCIAGEAMLQLESRIRGNSSLPMARDVQFLGPVVALLSHHLPWEWKTKGGAEAVPASISVLHPWRDGALIGMPPFVLPLQRCGQRPAGAGSRRR